MRKTAADSIGTADASPRTRISTWFLILFALALAGGSTFGVSRLVHRIDTARQAQLVISAIGSDHNAAALTPWGTQAGRSRADVARELKAEHMTIAADLDQLTRLDSSSGPRRIRELSAEHFRELERLADIVATRPDAEANAFDRIDVAPSLRILNARLQQEGERLAAVASSTIKTTIAGTAAAMLGTLAIIALLFWRVSRVEAQRRIEAETTRATIERHDRMREIDRTKDEFVATVSHELRTPLTSIRGYLELIDEDEGVSPESREYLGVIQRNSDRLLSLVGDLLFVAQDDAGQLELALAPLRPRELVEEAIASARPTADARQIRLVAHVEDIPDISGDRARLSQLLDNLLSNSLKFTPTGGRVDVRLKLEPDGSTAFEFQDNGIGIPKPEQDRLFKRFFRADAAMNDAIAGTGLGLSIVKAIAEAHGGSVSVESDEGEGATFRVVLPVSTNALPAAA
jgi:signal transduction histidine kinase